MAGAFARLHALGRALLRKEVPGETSTANQRFAIVLGLRDVVVVCVMEVMVYADGCFFAAAAPARFGSCPWRLACRRTPLFLPSQRLRLPFAGAVTYDKPTACDAC